MGLTTKDLKRGDVVFQLNSDQIADHVAIVTRIDGKDCYITHAVGAPHNAVVETLLKADHDDDAYQICRHKDPVLAEAAAAQATQWCKYRIPYDDKRFELIMRLEDSKEFCHPKFGRQKLLDYAKNHYQPNFFRAIKYAARRDMAATRPQTMTKRGLICSSFVALVYQVAELKPFVKTCDELNLTWVSDKYASRELLSQLPLPEAYVSYQEKLNSSKEYDVVKQEDKFLHASTPTWLPSFVAYSSSQPIDAFLKNFTSCFPLDSKIVTPAILQLHAEQASEQWENLGVIELEMRRFSLEERQAYRELVQENIFKAKVIQEELAKRCESDSPVLTGEGSPLSLNLSLGKY
ncbi:MAG: hypothetical protein K0S08_293 [Gammaproteobacteria bacterium]|jgi:hypothetical protein|nr:hypothetical protein [Gammaproteobacteria bacterium]